MNSENGGLSSEERQRRTAIEIARNKVLSVYDNLEKTKQSPVSKTTGPRISNEEWKRYHSAWQDYYQKYYSEYYSNAARQYVAKEKLKAEREKLEKESALEDLARKTSEEKKEEASFLKKRIQKHASDSAIKFRHRKKFVPILAGLAVILIVLFLQYNRLIFAPIAAYVSPGSSSEDGIISADPTIAVEVSPEPRLIIPKLNINVPVHFGISLDEVSDAMNNGVAHYRIRGASSFPGENGNTVITGHSAGDIYSNNQYKFIFSGLERLNEGDLIYINYNSVRYTYRMTRSDVVEPTNVDSLRISPDKPILTLITCTPLGTSKYRLLIFAEQISPTSGTSSSSEPGEEEKSNLPSNEPSMFERIWNGINGN